MHDIAVVTIHGSRDAFVKASQIEDSLKLLPADTVSVEIFGGNHSQFGWYGLQPGDNEALIDRLAQAKTDSRSDSKLTEKHKLNYLRRKSHVY